MSKPKSKTEETPVVKAYGFERESAGWALYEYRVQNKEVVSKTKVFEPDILHITVSKLVQKISQE